MNRNWVQAIPNATAYWLDKVLHDTQHNPELMERFQADPEAYLADLPLSDEMKRLLVEVDIGQLYLAGTNPYLLRAHCLHLRISEDDYLGALRAVAEEPALG